MLLTRDGRTARPHARLRLRQRLFRPPGRPAGRRLPGDHDPRVGSRELRGDARVLAGPRVEDGVPRCRRSTEFAADPAPSRAVRPGAPARRDRAHHGRPRDLPADPRRARRGRLRLHHHPRPRLAGQRRRDPRDAARRTAGTSATATRSSSSKPCSTATASSRSTASASAPSARRPSPGSSTPSSARKIDPLTVLFFPLLKLLSLALSPWRDPHTIFVLARKKRAGL